MKTLIAIPVYNESKRVSAILDRVVAFGLPVLCVDDGSTDATPQILESRDDIALLRKPRNQGYGASLISAFDYATQHGYDWVITLDADGQHEPAELADFMTEIARNDADLISGSRYMQHSPGDDLPPADRRAINMRATRLLNQRLCLRLTDSFCGYKAHRVKAMQTLRLSETGYAFPLQFWPRVSEHRLRVREIPVRLVYNDLNRTFGVNLDDARVRWKHYVNVLNAELIRMGREPVDADAETRRDAARALGAMNTESAAPSAGECCTC